MGALQFQLQCHLLLPVKIPIGEKQIEGQMKVYNLPEQEVVEKMVLGRQVVKSFIPIEKIGKLALFLPSDNPG